MNWGWIIMNVTDEKMLCIAREYVGKTKPHDGSIQRRDGVLSKVNAPLLYTIVHIHSSHSTDAQINEHAPPTRVSSSELNHQMHSKALELQAVPSAATNAAAAASTSAGCRTAFELVEPERDGCVRMMMTTGGLSPPPLALAERFDVASARSSSCSSKYCSSLSPSRRFSSRLQPPYWLTALHAALGRVLIICTYTVYEKFTSTVMFK